MNNALSSVIFCMILNPIIIHILFLLSTLETLEYARKIGINVEKESQLIYLAREGLLRELPSEWKPW